VGDSPGDVRLRRWVTRGFRAILPAVALLIWIHGLYFALSLLLRQTGPQTLVDSALVALAWAYRLSVVGAWRFVRSRAPRMRRSPGTSAARSARSWLRSSRRTIRVAFRVFGRRWRPHGWTSSRPNWTSATDAWTPQQDDPVTTVCRSRGANVAGNRLKQSFSTLGRHASSDQQVRPGSVVSRDDSL
jgi:hypothetical protein